MDLARDNCPILFEGGVGDQELPERKRSESSSANKWSHDEEFSVLFSDLSEYNRLNHPRPLGLNLKKSPILEELVEATLAHANKFNSTVSPIENLQPETKKDVKTGARTSRPINNLKASNFPAVLLKIGKWEYVSKNAGDLVAKCYFAKQKLVWEILDGGLKSKIELQWSDIVGLHANCPDNGLGTLTIVLGKLPLFFRETNPQPRKHTLWKATCDFTNGEASKYREHCLQCAPGILNKHYEKLIQYDTRLEHLSQQQDTELNLQFAAKGSNTINTPSLSRNMSISNLLNHIGHRISEKKPAPVLPFSENVPAGVNLDNMLENISDILLSDSKHATASDEESLMPRINSLCTLLQDENEYPNHDIEMNQNQNQNQNQVNGWHDVNDYSTLESQWDCSPIPMHELDNETNCMSWC